ncbi:MAG TPA: metal-sulfur cluster assembly factor [Nocardioidaceae bacterium]
MSTEVTDIDPSVGAALTDVYDPCCREKGISIIDMGLLHRASIDDGHARVEIVLTSGWCPFASTVLTEIEDVVRQLPGVRTAAVEIVWDEAWTPERLSDTARSKLRFLPPPSGVRNVTSYVAEHRAAAQPTADQSQGASHDR